MGHSSFQGQQSPAPRCGANPLTSSPHLPPKKCSAWSWLFIQDNCIKNSRVRKLYKSGQAKHPHTRGAGGDPSGTQQRGGAGPGWDEGRGTWGECFLQPPPGTLTTRKLSEPVTPSDRSQCRWHGQHRVPARGTRPSLSPRQREPPRASPAPGAGVPAPRSPPVQGTHSPRLVLTLRLPTP